jgi:hypothetical protein
MTATCCHAYKVGHSVLGVDPNDNLTNHFSSS